MESREVTAADGESTSLDDLCPGSDDQLRQCIDWIGDIHHLIRNLIDTLANEHAPGSLSDRAFAFAVARTRNQAHLLRLKRREAEDCLACLATDASEHLLTPLIEVATACTLIDSSDQNVREEGMDRFCAAADWWEREAKKSVELLLTAIEDRRRRNLGDSLELRGNAVATKESEEATPNEAMGTAGVDDLVTLSDIAQLVHLGTSAVQKYSDDFGAPVVPHAGRRPAKWSYSQILPQLKRVFDELEFPEKFCPAKSRGKRP